MEIGVPLRGVILHAQILFAQEASQLSSPVLSQLCFHNELQLATVPALSP